jgi:hypothetical protein
MFGGWRFKKDILTMQDDFDRIVPYKAYSLAQHVDGRRRADASFKKGPNFRGKRES